MKNINIKSFLYKSAIAATALAGILLFASVASADTTQNFGAGNSTFVVPAGVTQVQIQVWGAGGAGGDGEAFGGSNRSGFGGGAGGYSEKIVNVTPGQTISMEVGTGGQSNGDGGQGSQVSVNGSLLQASGGGGGMSFVGLTVCQGSAGGAGSGPNAGQGGNFNTTCSGGSSTYNQAGGQAGGGTGGDVNATGNNGGNFTESNGAPFASSGGGSPNGGDGGSRGVCGRDGSCIGHSAGGAWAQDGNAPGGGGGGSDFGGGGIGGNGLVILTYAVVSAPPVPTNTAPTIQWTSPSTGAVNGDASYTGTSGVAYTVTAHGHDVDGNLTQVNIWKNGVPFGFAGGGNGTDGDSTNPSTDAPGTYTYTAQSVDSVGATSPVITMTVTIPTPTPPPVTTYVLNTNIVGSGTVTSNVGGINCPSTSCSATYNSGTSVTLTASANVGYTFAGWSGACAGSGTSCTFVMNQNMNITATFTANVVPVTTYTLTTSVIGSGNVASNIGGINCPNGGVCSATYNAGTNVTLTATPAAGYSFTGWSGVCAGLGTTCTVTMNSNLSVTATFTANPITTYILTANIVGSGTVTSNPAGINCTGSCSAAYNAGTSVTLTATPAAGYSFTGWSGACGGTSTTCTVVMNSNLSVTATFTLNSVPVTTYTLNVAVVGSGDVTSNVGGINCTTGTTGACSATYNAGTTVNLTASANVGYTFAGWSGACSGTGGCTVLMNTNQAVTATFTSIPATTVTTYILNVSIVGSGDVTSNPGGINCSTGNGGTCSATYGSGTVVTLTASANSGYTFNGWSGSCGGTGTSCTVTMNSNMNVTATFTSVGGGGGPLNASCILSASAVYQGSQLTLTANPTGGATPYTYSWSGGDGLAGTSQSINHSYFTIGNYNSQVIVSSADGQSVTITCPTVSVLAIPPGGGGGGGGGLNQPDVSLIGQTNEPGALASAGVISLTQVPYTGLTNYPSWVYFLLGLAGISLVVSAVITIRRKMQGSKQQLI